MELLIAIIIALGFSVSSSDYEMFAQENPDTVDRAHYIIDNDLYSERDGGGIIIEEGND